MGDAAAAFRLTNVDTGATVTLSATVTTDAYGRTVVTLTFSGDQTDSVGALLSGRYALTVIGSAVTGSDGTARRQRHQRWERHRFYRPELDDWLIRGTAEHSEGTKSNRIALRALRLFQDGRQGPLRLLLGSLSFPSAFEPISSHSRHRCGH